MSLGRAAGRGIGTVAATRDSAVDDAAVGDSAVDGSAVDDSAVDNSVVDDAATADRTGALEAGTSPKKRSSKASERGSEKNLCPKEERADGGSDRKSWSLNPK